MSRTRRISKILPAGFGVAAAAVAVHGFLSLHQDVIDQNEVRTRALHLCRDVPLLNQNIDAFLQARESRIAEEISARGASIKSGQEMRVRWHGANLNSKTKVALVFIHGFSGGPLESEPLVSELAQSIGAHALFVRLKGHGLTDGEDFANLRAEDWLAETQEAIKIATTLGEKVVVIGMSTGASLALLANDDANEGLTGCPGSEKPAALILLSPNFHPIAFGSSLLGSWWGAGLVKTVEGDYHEFKTENAEHARRWTARYRSVGLIELMRLIRSLDHAQLNRIQVPVLTIYTAQDKVVRPDLIESRAKEFTNPYSELIDFKLANRHEIAGDVFDSSSVAPMRDLITGWVDRIGLGPSSDRAQD